jgi:hypothetical protein
MGVVMTQLGVITKEFQETLDFAQQQAVNGINIGEVEKLAESFWLRRAKDGTVFTAIAQLLYVLARHNRANANALGPAAVSLYLLQELESRDGEVLDYVIEYFLMYVSRNSEY